MRHCWHPRPNLGLKFSNPLVHASPCRLPRLWIQDQIRDPDLTPGRPVDGAHAWKNDNVLLNSPRFDRPLDQTKNAQVEGLGKVRGMGNQKRHRDVFGREELAESFVRMARAAIKNQKSPFVERSKVSSQGLTRRFDVRDEDVGEPSEENVTRDEAICGCVHGDVFGTVPILKNEGIERFVFCDDGRLHSRAIQPDTPKKRASVDRPWDANLHPAMVFHPTWNKHVDALLVGVSLSTHLVHVEDESWVQTIDCSRECCCVERLERLFIHIHTNVFCWQSRDVGKAVVPHVLEQDLPLDEDVVLVSEVFQQDPHGDRVLLG